MFLMLVCVSCGSEIEDQQLEEPVAGIDLTIPLADTRAEDGSTGTLDLSKLYLATYERKTGAKIDDIVIAGAINTSREGSNVLPDAILNSSNFGGLLSVHLPYDKYKECIKSEDSEKGLLFVAFYLPGLEDKTFGINTFTTPATLAEVSTAVTAAYTLSYPGSGSTDTPAVWQPANDMEVPMSGVLDVTSALKAYNPVLWNKHNPMFLNNDPLVLIRAMAKVTVEGTVDSSVTSDPNFITGVDLLTKTKGTLLFDPTTLVKDGNNYVVNKPLEATGDNRWIEGVVDENGKYEFYTFERDFSKNSERGVMRVHWNGHEDKIFDFKNYASGANQDIAPWNGILRNYHYQFSIKKPADQEFQIQVKIEKWTVYDYEEKI